MICRVKFYNEKVKGYSGRGYTYLTELPLQPYDKVFAPVYDNETKRAIVTEVDLPESVIAPEWADSIRSIERYDR